MMEQQNHSQQFLRQRKFFTVLPLMTLPFITLLFWALGGGGLKNAEAASQPQNGFNKDLPGVNFDPGKQLDKMSYYAKAALDSAKLQKLRKNDPYYSIKVAEDPEVAGKGDLQLLHADGDFSPSYGGDRYAAGAYSDSNEAKVYRQIDKLNKALEAAKASQPNPVRETPPPTQNPLINDDDVHKLEQMMNTLDEDQAKDPEMKQINAILEKILDIQHPRRLEEKLQQRSKVDQGQVFAVSAYKRKDPISLLDNSENSNTGHEAALQSAHSSIGFYSLKDPSGPVKTQNAIKAVVHQTQTLVNGSTVKLRLEDDVFSDGVLIPKGNFIYGKATLSGERLHIDIGSIRYRNSLFPVDLSVYDMDGMAGIYIPGAINRKVAKESADRSIQRIGINSFNPSWQTQAAGAGIEAAKNLISKKVKLIRVTVKAGYQVLLYDEKQEANN